MILKEDLMKIIMDLTYNYDFDKKLVKEKSLSMYIINQFYEYTIFVKNKRTPASIYRLMSQ